jgi:hypothetical protein
MRWKASAEPRIGDEKTTARFALLPTRLDDGYIVWLEWYTVHWRYETQDVATIAAGVWCPRTRWFESQTEVYRMRDFGGVD